jgi:replicative DNA helicase
MMDTLAFRAEQALLGAMLDDPGLVRALATLSPGDFVSPSHKAVYQALAVLAPDAADWDQSWDSLVARSVQADVPGSYLDELRHASPELLHGRAYAAMVLTASTRRMLAAHAIRLDQAADEITGHARRQAEAGGTGAITTASHAQHMSEVAQAIRGHAAAFDPDTITPAAGPPLSQRGGPAAEEETILTALLQGRGNIEIILRSLPEEAFTDPLRRQLFRAIATLYTAGKAVDPLCADWELAQHPAPAQPRPEQQAAPGKPARLHSQAGSSRSRASPGRVGGKRDAGPAQERRRPA